VHDNMRLFVDVMTEKNVGNEISES
jgi:hypothetical protein